MLSYLYLLLTKLDKYLKKILLLIGSIMFFVIFLILSIQVFLRNSPFRSLIWAEEFSRYFTIIFVCLTIPVLSSKREHPKVDLFVNYLPVSTRNIKIFIADITGIIFSYYLFREGIDLAFGSLSQLTPSLRWSWGAIYTSIPIMAFLTMFFLLINLILELYRLANYDKT